ncbi:general odorant-binding protein 56d-like [Armigeres subalbatus]|uniref:general odorant-binding protein 56d-like n=1 Tax=Armigeres subalbatus TaxID=124917 RepID=UPI002ED3C4FE
MKCLVLMVLLAVGSQAFFTEEQHEAAKKLTVACQTEIGEGLPDNVGDRFRAGDLTLTDDKSKCFMKCVFVKVGFIDDAGTVNKEVLMKKLSLGNGQTKSATFAEKCNSFEGANGCEKAHGLFECYWNNKAIFA